MGEPTDTRELSADLMTVVQLLARDAVASAMAAGTTPGIQGVTVNMVFDPPWDQSRMSDEARVALDMW